MSETLSAAILKALIEFPDGFPVSGDQLAEKLNVRPEVIQKLATEMGVLPTQRKLVSVITTGEEYTGKPAGFYVQLLTLDEGNHEEANTAQS